MEFGCKYIKQWNFDKQRSEVIPSMYLTLGAELNNGLEVEVGTLSRKGHWFKS